MTALITGAGGFVASHLADLLIAKGEGVIGTYRWQEDLSRIDHIRDKIKLVPMNLNDLSSCIKMAELKPEYIYHLAAESYVTDSWNFPHEAIAVNTLGTLNLLEAVRLVREYTQHDPLVLVCSSSEVYGQVLPNEVPIKETQEFRPQNPYGVGKVGADLLGRLYWVNHKVRTVRTRWFTHTGPRRTMPSAEVNFASQIAKIEAGLQEPIVKHGNLDSVRTFADVRDAVRGYWMLSRKCHYGEVYNIGGNHTCKIGDMLDYIIGQSGMWRQITKQLDPTLLRPADVTLQIPDISRFVNETGWQPEISFQTTMQDLLQWWREKIARDSKN